MKTTLLLEHLKKHIGILAKVVPSQSQVPVLLNVLLEATADGLSISATDLEMAIKVKIPAKIIEEGAITVSGKHFVEVINSLSSNKVSLTVNEEGMLLDSADGKIVLQTIPKEEFPSLFEQKGEELYTFSSDELSMIFSKLLFSVSVEDSRAELTGVHVAQKENGIDFVATDGYRLSFKHLSAKTILPVDTGMIISAKLLQEAMLLQSEKVIMFVHDEGNQVLFETEDITLVGRLISGNFPNYERVIPQSHITQITVDREECIRAIRLSSIFARESANIARLKVTDNKLTVFSRSSGVGEGEVHIEVVQEGDDNEIAFNVKFLNDLLRNMDDKHVLIELNSATEPAVFKSPKDKDYLHVIMPVRVQE